MAAARPVILDLNQSIGHSNRPILTARKPQTLSHMTSQGLGHMTSQGLGHTASPLSQGIGSLQPMTQQYPPTHIAQATPTSQQRPYTSEELLQQYRGIQQQQKMAANGVLSQQNNNSYTPELQRLIAGGHGQMGTTHSMGTSPQYSNQPAYSLYNQHPLELQPTTGLTGQHQTNSTATSLNNPFFPPSSLNLGKTDNNPFFQRGQLAARQTPMLSQGLPGSQQQPLLAQSTLLQQPLLQQPSLLPTLQQPLLAQPSLLAQPTSLASSQQLLQQLQQQLLLQQQTQQQLTQHVLQLEQNQAQLVQQGVALTPPNTIGNPRQPQVFSTEYERTYRLEPDQHCAVIHPHPDKPTMTISVHRWREIVDHHVCAMELVLVHEHPDTNCIDIVDPIVSSEFYLDLDYQYKSQKIFYQNDTNCTLSLSFHFGTSTFTTPFLTTPIQARMKRGHPILCRDLTSPTVHIHPILPYCTITVSRKTEKDILERPVVRESVLVHETPIPVPRLPAQPGPGTAARQLPDALITLDEFLRERKPGYIIEDTLTCDIDGKELGDAVKELAGKTKLLFQEVLRVAPNASITEYFFGITYVAEEGRGNRLEGLRESWIKHRLKASPSDALAVLSVAGPHTVPSRLCLTNSLESYIIDLVLQLAYYFTHVFTHTRVMCRPSTAIHPRLKQYSADKYLLYVAMTVNRPHITI